MCNARVIYYQVNELYRLIIIVMFNRKVIVEGINGRKIDFSGQVMIKINFIVTRWVSIGSELGYD